MKQRLSRLWAYMTAHKVISAVIILVILVGGYVGYKKVFGNTQATQYVLGRVIRGDLVTTVTGTGQVAAEDQVDIKPQGSSQSAETITKVYVKQGDQVKAGQLLAVVDNSSARIALMQAQASVQSAQANYDKTVNGATSATVAVSQTTVQNDLQSLSQKINDAYQSVQSALLNDVDPLYLNAQSFSPQFNPTYFDSSSGGTVSFMPTNQNDAIQLSVERGTINTLMINWQKDLQKMGTAESDITAMATESETNINQVKNFLNDIATTINAMSLQETKYGSALNSYKSDVATAQSSVSSAGSSIVSAQQILTSAEASLNQTVAPARPEDVATAQASLTNAKASLANAQQNYDQSFLRAPFDGVVAQVNVSPGDQASTATVVATIITQQQLAKISLNEVDAANVKIGDPASVTFDAIPDLTVQGTVAEIDTIGTVSQGVVTYNAEIAFNTQDSRVKPGMSTSVSITTGTEQGVLIVPSSAVKTQGNRSYVQVLDSSTPVSSNNNTRTGSTTRNFGNFRNRTASSTNTTATSTGVNSNGGQFQNFGASQQIVTSTTQPRSIPVQVGNSNDTETEITSGLTEGQQIIVRTINGSAQTITTTTGGGGLFGGGNRATGAGAARAIPR